VTVAAEVAENYARFSTRWAVELETSKNGLANSGRLMASYARMAAYNGLKESVLTPGCSDECSAFFLEAQNDLLTSHVLASLGVWRASLQSLRSFLENSLSGLYFKDHPIELRLWQAGQTKLAFSELSSYFKKHPDVGSLQQSVTGVPIIVAEYATLSKAVHGSAVNMRMTGDGSVRISSSETARLNAWATRQTNVVRGVVLLTLCLNKNQFTGTRLLPVRSVLGAVLTNTGRTQTRTALSISIPAYS